MLSLQTNAICFFEIAKFEEGNSSSSQSYRDTAALLSKTADFTIVNIQLDGNIETFLKNMDLFKF